MRVCAGVEGPLLPSDLWTLRAGQDLRDLLIQCPRYTGGRAEVGEMALAHHHPSLMSPALISQGLH